MTERDLRGKLLLGEKDASAVLDVSTRTVRKLAEDGQIPLIRIGRRRLYPVSGLRAFVRTCNDEQLREDE